MSAYYNENDKFAAAWLRALIKEGLIADGEVDERSISDVLPADLDGFTQCHFFAGIGGWSYALRLAGWPDDRPVWTGSCPCQPWSLAGRGDEAADTRHLWPAWFPIIEQRRPSVVFGEQVARRPGLAWLDIVQSDMESIDYSFGAVGLPACSFGAPHQRPRLWFVANALCARLPTRDERSTPAASDAAFAWRQFERVHAAGDWPRWSSFSPFSVFANGVPSTVGRTRGYGNAIVPQVAQAFIEAYMSI